MGGGHSVPKEPTSEIDHLFHDEDDSSSLVVNDQNQNSIGSMLVPSFFSQKEVTKETVDVTQFIQLINYNDLADLGYIPRNPNCATLLTTLDKIHREISFVVYVSHTWIRTDSSVRGWEGKPHPDYQFNYKFKLIVDGIDKMRKQYAPGFRDCYIWIDFTCLNQDTLHLDIEPNIIMFDKILSYADCIFTPVYIENKPGSAAAADSLFNAKNKEVHDSLQHIGNIHVPDYYTQYPHAPLWNDTISERAYLNRAWCRLELLYASVLPLLEDNGGVDKRKTKFCGTFRSHVGNLHRPHLLYTTYESKHRQLPIVMPIVPLTELLSRFKPTKGVCSDPRDRLVIKRLQTALKPLMHVGMSIKGAVPVSMKRMPTGEIYSGPLDKTTSMKQGSGMHKTASMVVYRGTYENDHKSGYGIEKTPTGVQYFGEYLVNKRHGHGLIKYPNGDTYSGYFKEDLLHGRGCYTSFNNDVHTGEYVNDLKCGYGEIYYHNGDSYLGMFKDDMFDGQGQFNVKDGHMFKGEWRKGLYLDENYKMKREVEERKDNIG